MLANVLPGVRELRVPLAAGAIYLGSLYILLFGIFRVRHVELDMLMIVRPYLETFGAPVVLSLLGFIAYLVGILIPQPSENMRMKLYKAAHGSYIAIYRLNPKRWKQIKDDLLNELRAPAHLSPLIQKNLEDYLIDYEPVPSESRRLLIPGIEGLFADVIQPLRDKLTNDDESVRGQQSEELDKLILNGQIFAARVQVKNTGLYNAYDRSEAEASFRYGLIGPIIALFIGAGVLLWTYISWNAFGLLVLLLIIIAALARRGREKQVESNDAVILSMLIGDVDPYERSTKEHEKPTPENEE